MGLVREGARADAPKGTRDLDWYAGGLRMNVQRGRCAQSVVDLQDRVSVQRIAYVDINLVFRLRYAHALLQGFNFFGINRGRGSS